MDAVFTICSNNYLAQASILGKSLKFHNSSYYFIIILCDEKIEKIDYNALADEVIPVATIEPLINELAIKYNIVELNTCIKPHAIQYFFDQRKMNRVMYLDPDIKIFSSLQLLENDLQNSNILLTPHIYTQIPFDDKSPKESAFLNFGLYNLGFIAVKNTGESMKFLKWWKNHTYGQGFIDPANGVFVDQLPINLAPLFFQGVKILTDKGLNMAPWNLHERFLTFRDEVFWVNNFEMLKFYHFSSFKLNSNELPIVHYNRFKLKERTDLLEIHRQYNEEVKSADYEFYSGIISAYSFLRQSATEKPRGIKRLKAFLKF